MCAYNEIVCGVISMLFVYSDHNYFSRPDSWGGALPKSIDPHRHPWIRTAFSFQDNPEGRR
jgi:hypothetical protein